MFPFIYAYDAKRDSLYAVKKIVSYFVEHMATFEAFELIYRFEGYGGTSANEIEFNIQDLLPLIDESFDLSISANEDPITFMVNEELPTICMIRSRKYMFNVYVKEKFIDVKRALNLRRRRK